MLPSLMCSCGERIALPYRSLRGTESVQPYWPTDSETLILVCSGCGKLSSHLAGDIRFDPEHSRLQEEESTVFWRVELICEGKDCESPVVAHIRISEDASVGEIGNAVANADPAPVCGKGHSPKLGAYPSIQEVAWTGSDGFLN
jgi:hypothetical protein